MTVLPRRPRWVYTDAVGAVDYSMSEPQRPWTPGSLSHGGHDVSAAGIGAAFVYRTDDLLHQTLRFPTSELGDVMRLLRFLQEHVNTAVLRPDRDVPAEQWTVRGVSPAIGEEIRPRRIDLLEMWEQDLTVRRSTAGVFDGIYMPNPVPIFASITPNTGPAAGGTAVVIQGDGFVPGSTVTIGGNPATSIVVVSVQTITCVTPAGTVGARDVVITEPGFDAGSVTAAGAYTYT